MADDPICPCEDRPTEFTLGNPPGRTSIAYRVGDFLSFRRALLKSAATPPDHEQQLDAWQPTAIGDLGLQMMEWWAYVGDILTFYNERIANETYLRTATLPESVRRIIRTIGYRPRPGIAAHGQIVALVGGHRAITLPQGLSFDSKPGPGESPQTFELDADTVVAPEGTVRADAPAFLLSPTTNTFLVEGSSVPIASGDVLRMRSPTGAFAPLLLVATSVNTETGEDGKKRTRVIFTSASSPPAGLSASAVQIQYASQDMAVFSNAAAIVQSPLAIHLAGVARDLHPGDNFALTAPGVVPELHVLQAIADVVWYANPPSGKGPDTPPPNPPYIPISILHSMLTPDSIGSGFTYNATTVRFGWRSVGTLLDQPVASFNGAPPTLLAHSPAAFPDAQGKPVIVSDANGEGMAGLGSTAQAGQTLSLSNLPQPPATLKPPLTANFNVLPISRGKTVTNEILGSGDATVPNQEFVLKKSPLTYLAKGDGYVSTLAVWVNGRLWQEARSFYAQPPDAEIFVTFEDEDGKTHVQFGDGVNGARLSSGVNNVAADYRFGSGAATPQSGEITVINKPYPNLKSVQNPVRVGGGADPDPPDQIRRFAPKTVLTFGRAVSGDDYESIAASAPGVTRVQALWSFDANEQRAAVKIYVGDDQPARDSAAAAIAACGDPHRHVVVSLATPVPVLIVLVILTDASHHAEDVTAAVRDAMLDDLTGLFGAHRLGIGEAIFNSAISEACLACDGAISLRAMLFGNFNTWSFEWGPRHDPGEGAFYRLDPQWLFILTEVDQHDG